MNQSSFITRFAPSPTGRLHLGHAYSACLAHQLASRHDGQFLLRIEDIDIGRSRTHFVDAIIDDLHWLGLSWQEPVIRQSQRFNIYKSALKRLDALGLIYPCWATRAEIRAHIEDLPGGMKNWPRDPDGAVIYPKLYTDISDHTRRELMWEGRDYAWRINIEKMHKLAEEKNGGPLFFHEIDFLQDAQSHTVKVDARQFGDVIIARKDIPTSYHLSVVIDDDLQNITHIVRGVDLKPAAHIHRLLQCILDLKRTKYCHHPLIQSIEGRRLSKTAGDEGFRSIGNNALKAEDVRALLPAPIGHGAFEIRP